MDLPTITLIGGPTALIEVGGLRRLTHPALVGPCRDPLPPVQLAKTSSPAIPAEQIGHVDAVLLSHDQHSDNLDRSGRAFLAKAGRVFTTKAGADRLGGHAEGLAPWDRAELTKVGLGSVEITATP